MKIMMCNRCSSIRFQNPSYDHRDEVEVMLDSAASDLAPGQHEYVNPIDDKFLKVSSILNMRYFFCDYVYSYIYLITIHILI